MSQDVSKELLPGLCQREMLVKIKKKGFYNNRDVSTIQMSTSSKYSCKY